MNRSHRAAGLSSQALRCLALLMGAALFAASCGSSGSDDASSATTEVANPETEEATGQEPATEEPGEEADGSAGAGETAEGVSATEWVQQEASADCMCADGSEFTFFTRTASTSKVMLYFEGGGACFSAETCNFDTGTYQVSVQADRAMSSSSGIFDFDNPANPFADWSVIFVPYCTGDVHIGDATTDYGDGLIVEHNGFVNANQGLDYLVENFPTASEVFVTGSSAGGVPSPLFGGLVSDQLPDAMVTVLADASGGYGSNPPINATLGQLWGANASQVDWPELEGVEAEAYGIPDLFVFAGTHDPSIQMARFDNAEDNVQATFASLTGSGDGSVLGVLDANEVMIEEAGIDLPVYIAAGTEHTILLRPELYELSAGGTSFIDWLSALSIGQPMGDVRCADC